MESKHFVLGAALATAGLAAACSGSGGGKIAGPNTGSLSVGLIDAPATDASVVQVEITSVRIKPAGDGSALEFPFDVPLQPNLVDLTPENAAWLLDGETVPAGRYAWLELELNAEFNGDAGSYVETPLGQYELRVPSASLRFVSAFTVTADQETAFLIDWDVRMGLVAPPGQPGYLLRPAFRIIDLTEFGTLSGTIDPALILSAECGVDDEFNGEVGIGNAVYIYAGAGATLDDIDDVAGDDEPPGPVATAAVEQNRAGDYVYSMLLSPGEYTVAFTCLAGFDDPLENNPSEPVNLETATAVRPVAFVQPTDGDVEIENGDEISVDF